MNLQRTALSTQMIHKFAHVPLIVVAGRSLIAGMVCSALETAGSIGWGHEALLLAVVPIVGWAGAHWWTNGQ
jgi:hypothetical protein